MLFRSNLVRNAAESMENGGEIILRTRVLPPRRAGGAGPMAVLEIEDSGSGLSADARQRLFDPFFTTKAAGTGLGLSIAARIVENHQGTLEYQPAPLRGSVFRLLLPIGATES